MAQNVIQILIEARDNATRQLQQAAAAAATLTNTTAGTGYASALGTISAAASKALASVSAMNAAAAQSAAGFSTASAGAIRAAASLSSLNAGASSTSAAVAGSTRALASLSTASAGAAKAATTFSTVSAGARQAAASLSAVSGSATQATAAITNTAKASASLTSAIAGFAGGIAATAMVQFSSAVSDAVGDLFNLSGEVERLTNQSAQFGVSIQDLQTLQQLLKEAGGSADDANQALTFLNRAIATQDPLLAKLGITTKDTWTAFNQLVQILAASDDAASRTEVAFQLLGRGVGSVLGKVPQLAAALPTARKEMDALNVSIGDRAVRAATELDASLDATGRRMAGLANTAKALVAEGLLPLAQAFEKLFSGNDGKNELERRLAAFKRELAGLEDAANSKSFGVQTVFRANRGDDQIAKVKAQIKEVEDALATISAQKVAPQIDVGALTRERDELTATLEKLRAAARSNVPAIKLAFDTNQGEQQIATVQARIAELNAELAKAPKVPNLGAILKSLAEDTSKASALFGDSTRLATDALYKQAAAIYAADVARKAQIKTEQEYLALALKQDIEDTAKALAAQDAAAARAADSIDQMARAAANVPQIDLSIAPVEVPAIQVPAVPPIVLSVAPIPPVEFPAVEVPPVNVTVAPIPPIAVPPVAPVPIGFEVAPIPPVVVPPVNAPPISFTVEPVPPIVVPPIVVPPITVPPVTVPPIVIPAPVVPQAVVPPIVVPPVTVPAITVPPIAVPEVKVPAISVPPIAPVNVEVGVDTAPILDLAQRAADASVQVDALAAAVDRVQPVALTIPPIDLSGGIGELTALSAGLEEAGRAASELRGDAATPIVINAPPAPLDRLREQLAAARDQLAAFAGSVPGFGAAFDSATSATDKHGASVAKLTKDYEKFLLVAAPLRELLKTVGKSTTDAVDEFGKPLQPKEVRKNVPNPEPIAPKLTPLQQIKLELQIDLDPLEQMRKKIGEVQDYALAFASDIRSSFQQMAVDVLVTGQNFGNALKSFMASILGSIAALIGDVVARLAASGLLKFIGGLIGGPIGVGIGLAGKALGFGVTAGPQGGANSSSARVEKLLEKQNELLTASLQQSQAGGDTIYLSGLNTRDLYESIATPGGELRRVNDRMIEIAAVG